MNVEWSRIAVLVALAVATAGVSGGMVAANTTAQSQSQSQPPLGAAISSFMQATDVEANATIETGLYTSRFNDTNASKQARLVHQRIRELQNRLAELKQARQEFEPMADGTVNVTERAKAARLAIRAKTLEQAIDTTANTAHRADIPVNETKLDRLRTEARNMTGQQVATVATGLVDIDRPAAARNRSNGPGNGPNGGPNGVDGILDNPTGNITNGPVIPADQSSRGNASDGSADRSGQSGDSADRSGQSGDSADRSGQSGDSTDGSGQSGEPRR